MSRAATGVPTPPRSSRPPSGSGSWSSTARWARRSSGTGPTRPATAASGSRTGPRDLQGNNDLLTLTQPEIIAGDPPRVPRGRRRHHRDQHLQRHRDLAGRLRHGGARLRAQPRGGRGWPATAADEVSTAGPAALRRRRARPDHADRVDLARRQRPGRPQRLLRPAGRGVLRGDPRPARRRRRPALHRDDLRHPQRQGRDLRGRDGLRGVRPPLAGHRLRHHHRRLRPHAVRPGHRGVLELDPARQPDRGRAQLRARRQGDAALHRRDVADRRHLRLLLPERRPAQRLRRVRRGARGDRRDHRRVRRGRLRQPGRRLLRHHARRTSPRSPRPSRASSAATPHELAAGHAALRARAVHASPRTACS